MPAPLELAVEVTDASGTRYRWDANQDPGNRPLNLSFRTKIGEGFSDAGCTLARRIDRDYPDLTLVDSFAFVGADGTVAYEGRHAGMPRDLDDRHSISVQLAGWMAHARDRKFSMIYVDRDTSAWGPVSRGRKLALLSGNFTPFDPSDDVDPTDQTAAVSTGWDGAWASPYQPVSEAWYDAGSGNTIKSVSYTVAREGTTIATVPSSWSWIVTISTDDKDSARAAASANLVSLSPATGSISATTPARYAMLQLLFTATPGGADGTHYGVSWSKLAVYGDHTAGTYPGQAGEPNGVLASNVIRDIVTRYCPALNANGVQDTTFVIPHLEFKDRVDPYDAFLEVNKYHLWHLGVWENRTLTFRPYDFTDYQWEIRTDDPGTKVQLQGDSTDNFFNGIVVTYTDLLTGVKTVLTPQGFTDLRDLSIENPWNTHGIDRWDEIELSTPTLQAQALQIGRAALVDRNRPKAPGTITVQGYIRDRSGAQQPAWRVRAGDTIAITNHPNDRPRLIHETSWDDSNKELTVSVDAPASALDAVFDRITNAIGARGLT